MKTPATLKTTAMMAAAAVLLSSTPASADPVEQINRLLDKLEQADQFSGNVLVASKDHLIVNRSIGFADQQKQLLNRTETAFRVASVTKGFTAVLALQAVERGELHLDDKLSKFFTQLKTNLAISRITVRHLLSHGSGLTDFAPHPGPTETLRDSLLRQLADNKLKFSPGSKYEYCNVGYTILGSILESVTGSSFAELMDQRIFKPAGMTASFLEDAAHRNASRARGYSADGAKLEEEPDLGVFLPAGGIVSTTGDLWRFSRALSQDRLLPQTAQTEMNTTRKGAGFGYQVRTLPTGATAQIFAGGMPGTSTVMLRINNGQHVIVLLGNRSSLAVQQIAQKIIMILLQPSSN